MGRDEVAVRRTVIEIKKRVGKLLAETYIGQEVIDVLKDTMVIIQIIEEQMDEGFSSTADVRLLRRKNSQYIKQVSDLEKKIEEMNKQKDLVRDRLEFIEKESSFIMKRKANSMDFDYASAEVICTAAQKGKEIIDKS